MDMTDKTRSAEIVTKLTDRSVVETVTRFLDLLSTRNLRLFAVINQREEARGVGLDLRETVLVLFGDPRTGTPVMDAEPLVALDLPLKILVWSDNRQTKVSYESPESLAARHRLSGGLASKLKAINALTDDLIDP
jgi:uncharacterized protein (DUF302 family)